MNIFNIAKSQVSESTVVENQVITFDSVLDDKVFENVKFTNVTFMKCEFNSVLFFNCSFQDVKFIDCRFLACNFKTCTMSDIKIVSTLLHVNFEYSRISRITLRHIKSHMSLSFTTVNLCELLSSNVEMHVSHCRLAFVRSYNNQVSYHINGSAVYSAISCCSTHYASSDFKQSDVTNVIYKKCTLRVLYVEGSTLKKVKFYTSYITTFYVIHTSLMKVLSKNTVIGTREIETSTFDKETSNSLFTETATGFIVQQAIIGYKKVSSVEYQNIILKLEIPKGAVVFSVNGLKCRTNKAKVLAVMPNDISKNIRLHSMFNNQFTYEVGKTYEIPDFDTRYNIECSSGIHFFKTVEEAIIY